MDPSKPTLFQPLPPGVPTPPALERFRAEIGDRPGYAWVEETFRRYRRPA